jgi:hypothetical protein
MVSKPCCCHSKTPQKKELHEDQFQIATSCQTYLEAEDRDNLGFYKRAKPLSHLYNLLVSNATINHGTKNYDFDFCNK